MKNETTITIELEQEMDGRWIAEVLEFPGCVAYGATRIEAVAKALDIRSELVADKELHHREGRVYTHIEEALHIEVMRNLLREALDTRAPDYVHVRYPGWADRVRKEIASHVR